MRYEELKNTDDYAKIGYGENTMYFQNEYDAIRYIKDNNLPHVFHKIWTDEFGYPHETPHQF